MIIGMYGDPREGKTLSAVAEIVHLVEEYKRRVVYSNVKLIGIPFTPLTPEMVIDMVEKDIDMGEDPIFFVDEIYTWLDSRGSNSQLNKVLSWFLMQSGKMGVNTDIGLIFLYTSQYPDLIDKRLWYVTNIKVFCKKFKYRDWTLIIQDVYEKKMFKIRRYRHVIDANKFYPYYNTRERVLSFKTDRFSKKPRSKT